MKDKNEYGGMNPDQSMIAAALLLGFFVVWFLWKALDIPPLLELLQKPDAAAWVQAVGALIMVGITVALFFFGERRRHQERMEERQLEVDEAKFYFLQNGAAFSSVSTYALISQIKINHHQTFEKVKLGSILNYPTVLLFSELCPQIERLHAEIQEFMLMQVPLGVPRMCISHVDKHRRVVSNIYRLMTANKSYIENFIEIGDIRKEIYEGYDLIILEDLEITLKSYLPELRRLTMELDEASDLLSQFMRS